MSYSLASIVSDFERLYWAPDGLARLHPDDKAPPFKGHVVPTVANENGILFLAEIISEFVRLGVDVMPYRQKIHKTLRSLRSDPAKPLYDRRPGDKHLGYSHDNMISIFYLCRLFGFQMELDMIRAYGMKHLWQFNNLQPRKIWSFNSWMLPREQALVHMCCGKYAGLIPRVHLSLQRFTSSKHKRMNKLRRDLLNLTAPLSPITQEYNEWWNNIGGYKWFAESIEEYYKDPQNPYRRLVQL